jgi:hypothetical protein
MKSTSTQKEKRDNKINQKKALPPTSSSTTDNPPPHVQTSIHQASMPSIHPFFPSVHLTTPALAHNYSQSKKLYTLFHPCHPKPKVQCLQATKFKQGPPPSPFNNINAHLAQRERNKSKK